MINAFLIQPKDDVVTVAETVCKGGDITYVQDSEEITIQAADDIPKYHKAAVRDIKCGENVHKYGEVIGHATEDICLGGYVHAHNVSDRVH
ncbi:UxaA family hydrolase [Lacrimispora sp. 210928-DFI.3.58]|nr:UxaA family hydrolase [Lacrimispora sp. 210928-DFI.3.58]